MFNLFMHMTATLCHNIIQFFFFYLRQLCATTRKGQRPGFEFWLSGYIFHWSLSHVRSFLLSVFLMIIITIISWQESYLFLHLLLLRSQLLATKKEVK